MIGKLVTPGVCAARRRFDSGSSPKKNQHKPKRIMENHFLTTNKKNKESWQKNAIYLSIGFRKRAALRR